MAEKAETKQVAGPGIICVAVHLSMLIVGAQYSGEEHCKLEASEYFNPTYYELGIYKIMRN